jgi:pyrroline-5-carboxylate reductase
MTLHVGIVGVGHLGGALAKGLDAHRLQTTLLVRRPEHASMWGPAAGTDPSRMQSVDVCFIAVKPAAVLGALAEVGPHLRSDALVISCAAGISGEALAAACPQPVARAMPNIGAAVGASTTALWFGARCEAKLRPLALATLAPLGEVREVSNEDQLHAVTAIAASGPAWILLVVEALVDAGVQQGLTRVEAVAYAAGALRAAQSRLVAGQEPAALRAEVTSPAGTTAAGLFALEQRAVRAAFLEATERAVQRSRDIGTKR